MRFYGLLAAMALVVGVSGAQAAVIYDYSAKYVYTKDVVRAATVNFKGGGHLFDLGKNQRTGHSTAPDHLPKRPTPDHRAITKDLRSLLGGRERGGWWPNQLTKYFCGDGSGPKVPPRDQPGPGTGDGKPVHVPEPATWVLFALGLVGLWVSRYKIQHH